MMIIFSPLSQAANNLNPYQGLKQKARSPNLDKRQKPDRPIAHSNIPHQKLRTQHSRVPTVLQKLFNDLVSSH